MTRESRLRGGGTRAPARGLGSSGGYPGVRSNRYCAVVRTAAPEVFVIGAGVSGLSAAIVLLEAGLTVQVYAAEPPHRTTSAVAGALWGPHLVGADERVGEWGAWTLRRLRELVSEPDAGIREIGGLVASAAAKPDPPAFTHGAGPLISCDPAELPSGFTAGWRYTAPVVAMPIYLDYLLGWLLESGGSLHLGKPLSGLADAMARSAAPVIVNCCGIGARDLSPDPGLIPVRGQVVVAANPGLTQFFVGQRESPHEVTYILPHGPTVVLGGTQQAGNTSLRPDHATAERIIADCVAVEPALAGVPILAHRVGLRPARARVRLEVQAIGGGRHAVHNYGHGGAGVSLSWGCAQAVLATVMSLLER